MRGFGAALTTIRRSPYQALSAILIITVTFLVGYTMSYILTGADIFLKYYEQQLSIIAFFEVGTEPSTITQLKEKMEQKEYVQEVKITTQEEALEIFKNSEQENPQLLELVSSDILPPDIQVSGTDVTALPKIKADLEQEDSIEEIDFRQEIIATIESWTNVLRTVGFFSIIFLATLALIINTVIIAMKVNSQKNAIKIMRLIGATRQYIQAPFVIEGMIYGFVGSLIAWGIVNSLLLYITPQIQAITGEVQFFPIPLQFYLLQFGVGTLAALTLGGFAGLLAVKRFIKR